MGTIQVVSTRSGAVESVHDVSVAVVDADGTPVAPGGTGELVIGGVGLARYLDPELDAVRFAPMPSLGWERAYRTGDLVTLDPEGLVFVGRADDQVKVNGHRIELGEVDAALQALPGVAAAAAAVAQAPGGSKVLVGYLAAQVPGELHTPDLLTLRAARLIETARVIVHDGLIGPDILGLARPDGDAGGQL